MRWIVFTSCVVAAGLAIAGPADAAAAKAKKAAKPGKAPPAAASVVSVRLSSEACEGVTTFNPGIRSKFYATNSSKTRSVDIDLKYDTNPSGLGFNILDGDKGPVAEKFPLHRKLVLAPGERRMVGCATMYRTDVGGDAYMRVPMAITLDSAAYVEAGQAEPKEDAASFARFLTQTLPDRTVCQNKTPAYLYLSNANPSRTIAFRLSMVDRKGRQEDEKTVTLPPMSNERIGCAKPDAANLAADKVLSAAFQN